MPTLGLAGGYRFCRCGDRLVFVSLSEDRYFAIRTDQEDAFKLLARGDRLDGADMRALAPLVHRGVLVPRGKPPRATMPICPTDEVVDLLDGPFPAPSATDFCKALFCEAKVLIRKAGMTLLDVEGSLARMRARSRKSNDQSADRESGYRSVSAAFHWTALLLPPADRCLIKALACISACGTMDLFPSLVFGVRVNPFVAHCWVQDDRLIVNDGFERIRNFTPILVL